MRPRPRLRFWLLSSIVAVAVAASLALLFGSPIASLLGDFNLDGRVMTSDLDALAARLGANKSLAPALYNLDYDIDQDDKIDVADLAIAGRGYDPTSTRVLHFARAFANGQFAVGTKHDVAIDGQDRLHIAWSDGTGSGTMLGVFYTRLDRYGNTLVDDIRLDSNTFSGLDGVSVATDAEGNAEIVWDCGGIGASLCHARVDKYGHLVQGKTALTTANVVTAADVAMSPDGKGHVAYTVSGVGVNYVLIDADGNKLINKTVTPRSIYPHIAADSQGNAHLLFERDITWPNPLTYARYGFGATPVITRDITVMERTGIPREKTLTTDAEGDAFIIWHDTRSSDSDLFLEKIDITGTTLVDDQVLWEGFHTLGSYVSDIAVAPDGDLHVVSPGSFSGSIVNLAYGSFTNDAATTYPWRWIVYGNDPFRPQIEVDSREDFHLVYRGMQPNCGMEDEQLCYQGTAFSAEANDRARPDLGLDLGSFAYQPEPIAKWTEPLVVSFRVFNAGWVSTTTDVPVRATLTLSDVALYTQTVTVPPMAARTQSTISVTFDLGMPPATPDERYESLRYMTFTARIDPLDVVTETTEANNGVSAPILVQPVPTRGGLFLMVQDTTETIVGRDLIGVLTGTTVLTNSTYLTQPVYTAVDTETVVTILGKSLHRTTDASPYTVTWSAPGYRPAPVGTAWFTNNVSDPYTFDYHPSPTPPSGGNTIVLYTDRLGSLGGAVSGPTDTVTIKLAGSILITSTTSVTATQTYTFPRLIPDDYEIRLYSKNFARVIGSVRVGSLQDVFTATTMVPTSNAYVRGLVQNTYGYPVGGATIQPSGPGCSGPPLTTDASGAFDAEIPASCTLLTASRTGYDAAAVAVSLEAGLETEVSITNMTFNPPAVQRGGSGAVASWIQDEKTGDLLPDAPDDASWLKKKVFEKAMDKFWPKYRVQVWWGCYEFSIYATYAGGSGEYHMYDVDVTMTPRTFEAHRVSSEVDGGKPMLSFNLGLISDSGERSVVRVVQARLVDASTGDDLAPVARETTYHESYWDANQETSRTYDFGGAMFSNLSDAQIWLYLKIGQNEGGKFESSPILRGYHLDQQLLIIDLSSGTISGSYTIDFPMY